LVIVATAILMSQSVLGAPPAFNDAQLCQAAIATSNGHSANAVNVVSSQESIVEVSYIRPSDGKRFKFWCKIEPAEIRWKDEYTGRWSQKLRVYYKLLDSEKTLEVRSVIVGEGTYPDIKTFTHRDFN
jgi:hypothetical protein